MDGINMKRLVYDLLGESEKKEAALWRDCLGKHLDC